MQTQQNVGSDGADSVLGDFLTREELARELRVTTRTLARWKWGRKGPPCVRLGGRVLYARAEVKRWLAGLSQDGE